MKVQTARGPNCVYRFFKGGDYTGFLLNKGDAEHFQAKALK